MKKPSLPLLRRRPTTPADSGGARVKGVPYVITLGGDGRLYGLKYESGTIVPFGDALPRHEEIPTTKDGLAYAYMASDWAFRCIELRATKIAELMASARLRDNATDSIIEDHPFLSALSAAYRQYEQDFFYNYAVELDIYGETFVELISIFPPDMPIVKYPHALRVLPGLAVSADIQEGRIVKYIYQSDSETVALDPSRIIHDRYYNPYSTLTGLSPLAGALSAVNLELLIVKHNSAYFKNGARPSLIISPKAGETFNDTEYSRVSSWLEKNKGVSSFFKPLPLSRPIDVTVIEYPSLEDQRYLSDDQRTHICSRLGVPIGLVSYADQRYQLSPEQRINFHANTIIPLAKRLCRAVNEKILPLFDPARTVHFELDPKELSALVEDEVKKDEMVRQRYLNGQISHNEMRAALRMKPAESDFFVLPIGHRLITTEQFSAILQEHAQTVSQEPLVQTPALLRHENESARSNGNGLTRRRNEYHPPTLPSFEAVRNNAPDGKTLIFSLSDLRSPQEDQADAINPFRELRAWRRVATRRGKNRALKFEQTVLPDEIAQAVRMNLAVTDDHEASLAQLFKRASVWLSAHFNEPYSYDEGKAIQATRLEFENAFDDAMKEALAGGIDRRRWSIIVRSLIYRWGHIAYRDGLADGGVSPDALTPQDRATIDRLIRSQSSYVTQLGERLFSTTPPANEEVANKAETWFNKSIMPFYHAGRLSADKDGMYRWQLGDTNEHCSTCTTAHGQRHRLSEWHASSILPQSDVLECKGYNCRCTLVKDDGPPVGDLSALLATAEHNHD